MMRAKFKVDSLQEITEFGEPQFSLKMSAVTTGSDENKDFNKYTPSGELEMFIDNPKAVEFLKEGKEYYLDFSEASE